MKSFRIFSFLIFYSPFLLFTQSVWYFGNGAGLDFSSGSPKTLQDGTIYSLEGCAIAYDEKGRILFYTDGITVWNKSHKEIKNGTGLNGSQSSTQAALIVPKPGAEGDYFLFTTDEKAGSKGLCYSVVHMSSGSGVVTQKNIQLLGSSAEKLTIVRNESKNGFWVIAHQWNSNNFYVFPVTAKGVGSPVISSVGASHAETGAGDNKEAIGSLCTSFDGKKIASAICYRTQNNLEVFDFESSTGRISNPTSVLLNGFPYGLCFSPDNTKLYISCLKGKSGIIQYDMADRSSTEITVNEKENSFGGLQLAPNGKLYIARAGVFLDAIESPNEKGISCKYKKGAVDLSPASCNYGLPNVWLPAAASSSVEPVLTNANCSKILEKPFSGKNQLVMTEIFVCESTYALNAKNPGASYRWSTGASTQQITADTSKKYHVTISKQGCTVMDSVRLKFRKEVAVFRHLSKFNPESAFLNSEFYYDIDDVSSFKLTIFDIKKKRIVFETKNIKVKWNGKNPKGELVPAGEYFWEVAYKPNCPKDSKAITKEGVVVIERNKK